MICNTENPIINQPDFDCIGQVATHCDLSKLCIGINQAEKFDMTELFCGFWDYILTANAEVNEYDALYQVYLVELAECEADPDCTTPPFEPVEPENYELNKNLLCGGKYESCNGKNRTHLGVKEMFVYYSYARYVIINGYNDTPTGLVTKTNEFSLPVPLKEVQMRSDNYRTMGYTAFKGIQNFICKNKDVFTDFDSRECKGCGCGGNCDEKTKAKGYGMKSSIVKKEIPNNYHYRDGRL